eukprot:CAMPEP_0179952112 /NCGR_PEP_ID=MMETSP0983-20121128/24064_1 /TAXON_ID=483367 /ORGANISM="non described non described, Strain CCMP 2436" /LENGTH=270 /DNA_ID=CAMNT_0021862635 /DNA_START=336 /DNA_END=1148 /DNA_ORIENTATION=-
MTVTLSNASKMCALASSAARVRRRARARAQASVRAQDLQRVRRPPDDLHDFSGGRDGMGVQRGDTVAASGRQCAHLDEAVEEHVGGRIVRAAGLDDGLARHALGVGQRQRDLRARVAPLRLAFGKEVDGRERDRGELGRVLEAPSRDFAHGVLDVLRDGNGPLARVAVEASEALLDALSSASQSDGRAMCGSENQTIDAPSATRCLPSAGANRCAPSIAGTALRRGAALPARWRAVARGGDRGSKHYPAALVQLGVSVRHLAPPHALPPP